MGLWIYSRQINQREREKLVHKKALILELAGLKKEIRQLREEKQHVGEETVIG